MGEDVCFLLKRVTLMSNDGIGFEIVWCMGYSHNIEVFTIYEWSIFTEHACFRPELVQINVNICYSFQICEVCLIY